MKAFEKLSTEYHRQMEHALQLLRNARRDLEFANPNAVRRWAEQRKQAE